MGGKEEIKWAEKKQRLEVEVAMKWGRESQDSLPHSTNQANSFLSWPSFVEVPGIEPGSSSTDTELLRA